MNQTPTPPAEALLGLRDYLAILRLRKWSIIALAGLSVGAALAFSIRQTPMFRSQTKVLVQEVDLFPGQTGTASKINMETEKQLAQSPAVARLAAENLGVSDADELLTHITVAVERDTEILDIGYLDPRPRIAQRGAQAFADAYLQFRLTAAQNQLNTLKEPLGRSIDSLSAELRRVSQQLTRTKDPATIQALQFQSESLVRQIGDLQTQLNELIPETKLQIGQVVAPAVLPDSPASPNKPLNVGFALLIGLALGVGVAFLRERLDDRFRGMSDLEAFLGAPVLAGVPRSSTWRNRYEEVILSETSGDPAMVEAYRTLRAGLLIAAARAKAKVILVTSPEPGEGKTTTTANLAVAIAHTGKRVVAVSADYRRPRLHRFFTIGDEDGLAGVLAGSSQLTSALVPSSIPNLSVLPSGRLSSSPNGLLGEEALSQLIGALKRIADIVLIDVAPVLGVADAVTLAPLVDGVLFVADAEKTTRRAVGRARQQLEQVNGIILGAVFNKFRPAREFTYPYYESPGKARLRGRGDSVKKREREPERADGEQAQSTDLDSRPTGRMRRSVGRKAARVARRTRGEPGSGAGAIKTIDSIANPPPKALKARTLGSGGPEITVIGLGTWAVGGPYEFGWGPVDDEESVAAVRHAVESGINWIDTAPVYGLGHSEEVVGRAVQPWKVGEEVFVFTKCGRNYYGSAQISSDLRPATIRRECEESLKRLGVDRIDLLQFHWPDPTTGTLIEDSWGTMGQLIQEGKVRWGGVSNFDTDLLERCERIRHIDSVQPPLNLINRTARDDVIPWCVKHEAGVIVYAPLASGLLTGRFDPTGADPLAPDDWRRRAAHFQEPSLSRTLHLVERLRPLAARLDTTLPALAVGWTLAVPGVTGAIVGARRPEQVDGWIAAGGLDLPQDALAEIELALSETGLRR